MRIIGTGSARPSLVVTNAMLENFLDTSDEWIVTRTGIHERRVISSENLEDLASTAALRAMEDAGVTPEQIDFIICSNVVNEYVTPGLGCIIQGKIGATCPTMDINCACTGFIYALDIAESYLATKDMKNILIVCAEEPSRMMNWKDRSSCILFGDAAGAAVVTKGDDLKAIRLSTHCKVEALYQKRKLQPTPFLTKEESDGGVVMNGQDVFKLAVSSSIKDIDKVLGMAGITADDIDLYVLHQANVRIIEAIQHFVKQDRSKFPVNLNKYGNVSSASIPALLDDLNRGNKLRTGEMLLLSAFGAGFTTGACILRWSK
ncbi:MAG TPA: ketoacyl-ACP synthase III [Candidatus Coprenecus stercoravium]|uniref:Ketoacyl-ACP synthase III n=1 Tax=Candidatus Coprenecus stercoravium TaxID=2840735 RepID=A0A9D2GQR7_9BACT|nr:ketoacyl-ACP synthase III [Candidatus Coprenecus stercoravium]